MNQRLRLLLVLGLLVVLILSLAGCNRERPATTNDKGTPAPARGTLAAPTNSLTPAAPTTGTDSTGGAQSQTPTAPSPLTQSSPASPSTNSGSPATGQAFDYTVVAGDNLAAIAARFGVTVDAIAQLNSIADRNALTLGQVLKIPGTATTNAAAAPTTAAPAAATSTTGTYTVQPGDTLGRIALRFGTTAAALAQLNGLTNPDQLKIGQQLKVPGVGGATTGSASTGQGRTHLVQRGETLGTIAKTYGVTVAQITAANNIADADRIFVGQKLIIP